MRPLIRYDQKKDYNDCRHVGLAARAGKPASITRRSPASDHGALASVAAVAVVTGAIELLEPHVPVLSLGMLYIFAVLPVAIVWGLGFGIAVAIASMPALNFFFLPPLYTFTLADSRNWLALAVFLVTAVVVSGRLARWFAQALCP